MFHHEDSVGAPDMAITKITRDALNTGIDDNSDATAITIDSSGGWYREHWQQ